MIPTYLVNPLLTHLFDDFVRDGLSESDAEDKAVMMFSELTIEQRSSNTTICPNCGATPKLVEPKQTLESGMYQCKKCEKSFSSRDKLKDHIYEEHSY